MFHVDWSRETTTTLGVLALQATVLLAATQIAGWALRKRSAAARHRLWTLAMLGLLSLPWLSLGAPAVWTIHVPPSLAAAAPAAAPPASPGDPNAAGQALHAAPTQLNDLGRIAEAASESYSPIDSPLGPVPQPAARRPFAAHRAGPYLPWIWAVGAGFCLLGLALSAWRVRRLLAATRPPARPELEQLCDELAAGLGVRPRVTLREHATSIVPLTYGIWRPAIALPREVHAWSAARQRMVLLHELGHIRRHDVAWQWAGQLACALYWFHPLAWLGLRQLRREAEQACDDLVLHSGERASDYAAELVAVARLFHGYAGAQVVAMARRGSLEGRLRSLLDADVVRSHAPLKRRSAWLLLGAALLGVSVVSGVRLAGQTPAEEPPAVAGPPVDDGAPPQDFFDESFEVAPRTSVALDYSVSLIDSRGQPVVGARLMPWGIGTLNGTGWGWFSGWPQEFTSNHEGVVRIRLSEEQTAVIPPDHGAFTFVSFRVEHPDYAATARSVRRLSDDEPVVLETGFVVAPHVVDAVAKTPLTADLFAYSSGALFNAWSNDAGELRSPRLDPHDSEAGRYFRVVHVPREPPDTPVRFSDVVDLRNLEPLDGLARPELPLHLGVRLSGQLAPDVPRPVREGRVLLQILSDSDDESLGNRLVWIDEGTIDADGEFEFPYVPRQSHVELVALCDGWVSTLSSADAAAYDAQFGTSFLEHADDEQTSSGGGLTSSIPVRVEQEPTHTTLRMRRTGVCEVRVVDEEGRPVDRAVVMLWPNQFFRAGSTLLGAGDSLLRNLRSGKPFAIPERENAAIARFTRVTDAQGRATIHGAPLGLEMAHVEYPGYELVPDPTTSSRTSSRLPFAVVEIRADATPIQSLRLRRAASPNPPPAQFAAAEEAGVYQFRLRIVDPQGAPLPKARVLLRGQDLEQPGERQAWPSDWMAEHLTNDAGLVLIRVQLPGAVNLQAFSACRFWLDVECAGYTSVRDYECSLSLPLPVRLQAAVGAPD